MDKNIDGGAVPAMFQSHAGLQLGKRVSMMNRLRNRILSNNGSRSFFIRYYRLSPRLASPGKTLLQLMGALWQSASWCCRQSRFRLSGRENHAGVGRTAAAVVASGPKTGHNRGGLQSSPQIPV